MLPFLLIAIFVLGAAGFLFTRYRQGKIIFLTDLGSRILGCSFFIGYVGYQFVRRQALNIGWDTPLHIMSWVNWVLIMMIFIFLIAAYLIRHNPIGHAKGLRETVLPLWCAATPAILLETPRWFPVFANSLSWQLAAFSFLIIGHTITLISFLYLGKAFSIMVQARHVVQHGPYRFIRHPIYVGEGIAIVGILLTVPNWINLVWVIVWLVAQWMRAQLEEVKLAAAFSDYTDYKRKTGSFFPKTTKTLTPH